MEIRHDQTAEEAEAAITQIFEYPEGGKSLAIEMAKMLVRGIVNAKDQRIKQLEDFYQA